MEKIIIELSCHINSLPCNDIVCYVYDILTSTNVKAWELCQENIQTPFVVVAKQQTAGKGQRGNHWHSSLGGLYLTVVLSSEMIFSNINHLTLFCGVGITEELNKYGIPIQIKWLNDLFLENKKVGGILSEVRSRNETIKNVVMGVGINWKNELNVDSGISLDSYLKSNNISMINSYDELLKMTVQGIFNGYTSYGEGGVDILINNYNKYLIHREKGVRYGDLEGLILGIDNNGNLLVRFSSMGARSKVSFSPLEYGITPYRDGEISKIFEREIS
ncbi:MAG: biotin--[acetyl-CoA-carboxylase] ligase [Cyanobacterium sp.]